MKNIFEIDGNNLWPQKYVRSEFELYEIAPPDNPKLPKIRIGICEEFGGFFYPEAGSEYILVCCKTGMHPIQKKDIDNIHDGSITYTAEKLNTDKQTAKIILDFIRNIGAIKAKSRLLRWGDEDL